MVKEVKGGHIKSRRFRDGEVGSRVAKLSLEVEVVNEKKIPYVDQEERFCKLE